MHLSLKALQAFEAAARTCSFAAAASELNVSAAAISQLVRGLEHRIGRPLFSRAGRQVRLTEAGREALPRLSTAFTNLQTASDLLTHRDRRARVSIALPASMAMGWLPHRLPDFLSRHENIDLKVVSPGYGERPAETDLQLSYGPHPHSTAATDGDSLPIDYVMPVCSPDMVRRYGPFDRAESLASAPLISTDWGPDAANFPDWSDFLPSGTKAQPLRPVITAPFSATAVQLALGGVGIALVQGLYAAAPLQAGLLLRPVADKRALAQPYHLTRRAGTIGSEEVETVRDWVLTQMTADIAATA